MASRQLEGALLGGQHAAAQVLTLALQLDGIDQHATHGKRPEVEASRLDLLRR